MDSPRPRYPFLIRANSRHVPFSVPWGGIAFFRRRLCGIGPPAIFSGTYWNRRWSVGPLFNSQTAGESRDRLLGQSRTGDKSVYIQSRHDTRNALVFNWSLMANQLLSLPANRADVFFRFFLPSAYSTSSICLSIVVSPNEGHFRKEGQP